MRAARLLLTRAPEDQAALREWALARGFVVLERPALTTTWRAPSAQELAALDSPPDAWAFTSRRAVEAYELALARGELPPACGLVTAVGKGTAARLAAAGLTPLVAEPETGAVLARLLAERLKAGAHVAWPCGEVTREEFPLGLRAAGLVPVPLTLYASVLAAMAPLPEPVDVVFVASPRAARHVLESYPALREAVWVALGTTTAAALREAGILRIVISVATDVAAQQAAVERALDDVEEMP